MTTAEARTGARHVPFAWSVRAAWLLALVAAALQLIAVLIAAGNVPAVLSAEPVQVQVDTAVPLTTVGRNSYSGRAFVADEDPITATRATAQVHGLATSTRVGLAFGPLAWALTGASVAMALTSAFGRLVRSGADVARASRAFVCAAAVVAVGTSLGQVLDGVARTGVQQVLWHGRQGITELGTSTGFTFQFGWLAASVGVLAIAAVVARRSAADA